MQLYEGASAAKEKFEEKGGSEYAMQTVDAACVGAVWAGEKVLKGAMFAGS